MTPRPGRPSHPLGDTEWRAFLSDWRAFEAEHDVGATVREAKAFGNGTTSSSVAAHRMEAAARRGYLVANGAETTTRRYRLTDLGREKALLPCMLARDAWPLSESVLRAFTDPLLGRHIFEY